MLRATILALALFSASTFARTITTQMTCNQIQTKVRAKGAVVLYTGRHTFDRYVSSWGYCDLGTQAMIAWVPAADAKSCWAGYTCQSGNY